MPRDYPRNRRVGDLIQRELAGIIQQESLALADQPMANLITVAKVDLSPDLSYAKVYVTSLDDSVDRRSLLKNLNEQAGHYRHCLSKLLTQRSVPRLKFVYDEAQERGARLSHLIDSLQTSPEPGDDDTPSES